jgi:hypothetical protein
MSYSGFADSNHIANPTGRRRGFGLACEGGRLSLPITQERLPGYGSHKLMLVIDCGELTVQRLRVDIGQLLNSPDAAGVEQLHMFGANAVDSGEIGRLHPRGEQGLANICLPTQPGDGRI